MGHMIQGINGCILDVAKYVNRVLLCGLLMIYNIDHRSF